MHSNRSAAQIMPAGVCWQRCCATLGFCKTANIRARSPAPHPLPCPPANMPACRRLCMWTPLWPNWTVLARMPQPPAAAASSQPLNMCTGHHPARSCRWSPGAPTVSHWPLLLPRPPACIAYALLLCCFGVERCKCGGLTHLCCAWTAAVVISCLGLHWVNDVPVSTMEGCICPVWHLHLLLPLPPASCKLHSYNTTTVHRLPRPHPQTFCQKAKPPNHAAWLLQRKDSNGPSCQAPV